LTGTLYHSNNLFWVKGLIYLQVMPVNVSGRRNVSMSRICGHIVIEPVILTTFVKLTTSLKKPSETLVQ